MTTQDGGRKAPTSERIITLDGRQVLTTEQVAARWNVQASSARASLSRARVQPDDHLDSRTPVYYPETIAGVPRPGRGRRTDLARENA